MKSEKYVGIPLLASRVPEARHVHRVAAKAPHVDAVIPDDVPVETVVVPNLEALLGLEEGPELLQDRQVRRVNPQRMA